MICTLEMRRQGRNNFSWFGGLVILYMSLVMLIFRIHYTIGNNLVVDFNKFVRFICRNILLSHNISSH